MKNSRYYPFERNRYFYGKLLTVRDFETEQKYFNDKRRMINRLLFGSGVVCGLQVVAIDDKTVSVEMGMALDGAGREIIVASPVTQKLSMIEGFTNNEYAKNVYLCIAYDEKGKEPVHSAASSTVRTEEISEYNRIQEGYRLFIKEEEPDPSAFEYVRLASDIQPLYNDRQIRLWQTVPRYVKSGEVFEVTVKLEKNLQTARLGFEYEITLENASPTDGNSKISFKEPDFGQEAGYEFKYKLRASDLESGTIKIGVKPGSGKLYIEDKSVNMAPDCINTSEITGTAAKDRILNDYFEQSLEKCLECPQEECVYLARINLLQVGPTYMIEKVERVPYGEYVHNASLLYKLGIIGSEAAALDLKVSAAVEALGSHEKPRVNADFDREKGELRLDFGLPKAKTDMVPMTGGSVDISLEANAKPGKSYFSEEINHGLGEGSVLIHTACEEPDSNALANMEKQGGQIFFGDYEVFDKSPYEALLPKLSMGVVLYPEKGTFRIGIRLKEATGLAAIRVQWWAGRPAKKSRRADTSVGTGQNITVQVEPNYVKINTNQKYQFTATVEGTEDKQVEWEASGGWIDENGSYTAPDGRGIYEITARSSKDPSQAATALVAVGER